jgi:hypothetical protein
MSSRVRAWLFVSVAVVLLSSTAVADAGADTNRGEGRADAKRLTAQVFNDCDAGFQRVVERRGHAFVSVALGVRAGCARWDCGVGWRSRSPYADGADPVFAANQKRRSGSDHRGCDQNDGSSMKPRHFDQHDGDDDDDPWWQDRGPRIDAVIGDVTVAPASPASTPVKVQLTPTTTVAKGTR